MRNDDLELKIDISIRDDNGLIPKYLAKDLVYYNFNLEDWEIDMSEVNDHYNELVLSDIGIVNKNTKEIFGGWSDYIATSDGKELYVFWDLIHLDIKRKSAEKYKIKAKKHFGVPPHIQKQFSDKLKQEILEEKHCGSTSFFRSVYLNDVIKELLIKRSEYYEYANSFFKNLNFSKISLIDLASTNMSAEEKLIFIGSMGVNFYQNKNLKQFIKYDKGGGNFLIINDKREILEYWQLPEEDLNKYVGENNFEPLDEEYFNLYFGLITKNKE